MTEQIIAAGKGITLIGEAANAYIDYLYADMLIGYGMGLIIIGVIVFGIYALLIKIREE